LGGKGAKGWYPGKTLSKTGGEKAEKKSRSKKKKGVHEHRRSRHQKFKRGRERFTGLRPREKIRVPKRNPKFSSGKTGDNA